MQPEFSAAARRNLFGSRGFYRRVLVVVLPIIIQNALTNFVGLLDNVMVGQVGTLPMSAVAIVNQLLFVFNLCIFGSTAGAGIYGAQFYGSGDLEGVRQTFRFKMLIGGAITAGALVLFGLAGVRLTGLYIAADTAPDLRAATLGYARQYLLVMLPGLVPFFITQAYSGTLRQCGQAALPMKASITAMAVNFAGNGLLIFGLFGAPRLGVVGAGIATALSRYVELAVVVIGSWRGRERWPYMQGLYRPFTLPRTLAGKIFIKTLPLLLNEFLWSLGQAALLQCYSVRGIDVVAAMNISNTISGVFISAFLALGDATAILVGQELGANALGRARTTAWRMLSLSVFSCVALGALLALCAPVIPRIYNTEPAIRRLATQCLWVVALCMPLQGFANSAYFTLRSGGRTFITFLFDSCFSWLVSVPAAFLLARGTDWPVAAVFLLVSALDFIKCVLGFALIRKGVWVKNIVA